MKIAIVGAGGIGGYVGVKLALSDEDMPLIILAPKMKAIQKNAMKLIEHDGTEQVATNVRATNSYEEAGQQDLVILALKAHQVEAVMNDVPKLFGPEAAVVTMQNGIPYWYFHGIEGELKGRCVTSVDPTGQISKLIPAERVIGCVVYPASEQIEPDDDRQNKGERFPFGELDGSSSDRVNRISECFTMAGFKAPVLDY